MASRFVNETPNLRWFKELNLNCRQCGKLAVGELMSSQNESYGLHCKRCAERRLKDSKAVRDAEARFASHPSHPEAEDGQ